MKELPRLDLNGETFEIVDEAARERVLALEENNVAINDQTPIYTEATELSKLTSGEKLSVAFGKIAKAVSSLISHLTDNNNPHSVTKYHVGLGNVDNTSDLDKPVSTAQRRAIDEAYANSNYYTDEKIADLINGAPSTLDTLGEIADAMAENEDVVEALEEAIGKKANESEFTSHVNDSANPHGVTKEQVGLGNVPNVATNNQTVTYTEAGSLAELSSGEKMSTAFGKLKLAVKNVISLVNLLGSTDISAINDGTVTGAISTLNSNLPVIQKVTVTETLTANTNASIAITAPTEYVNCSTGGGSSAYFITRFYGSSDTGRIRCCAMTGYDRLLIYSEIAQTVFVEIAYIYSNQFS